MILFRHYISHKNKNFDTVELAYSALHFIGGNPVWFCRIWNRDWIDNLPADFGESYGGNKFEAYRLALKDLNRKIYGSKRI